MKKIRDTSGLNETLKKVGSVYSGVLDEVLGGSEYRGNFIELIENVTETIGSCQPSKVLFPHQFQKNRTSFYGQETRLEIKRFYNLSILSRNSSDVLDDYNWEDVFTSAKPVNDFLRAGAIRSNNIKYSLSSHAFLDSLLQIGS